MDIAPMLRGRDPSGQLREQAITFGWLGKTVAGMVVAGVPLFAAFAMQMTLQVHALREDVSKVVEGQKDVATLEARIRSLEAQINEDHEQIRALLKKRSGGQR